MSDRRSVREAEHAHDWRTVSWEGRWKGLRVMHMKPDPRIDKGIGLHGCEKCFICGAFKCDEVPQ